VLTAVTEAAARRHPADLPAMGAYVTGVLSRGNGPWPIRAVTAGSRARSA
jgi:hypothetical protein